MCAFVFLVFFSTFFCLYDDNYTNLAICHFLHVDAIVLLLENGMAKERLFKDMEDKHGVEHMHYSRQAI